MKKHKVIKKYLMGVLAGFVVMASSVIPIAGAANADGTPDLNSFSMSPMYEKIVLNPGEDYTSTFRIRNLATAAGTFYYNIFTQPYFRDENNNTIFTDVNGMSQITEWTTIDSPAKGSLGPGEATDVQFSIKVPENAPAGGQYMAITVASDTSAEGKGTDKTGIMIQESVAMGYTVYAEITGETIRTGNIVEASVPSFMISGNIKGISIIENTGNVHDTATYKLQVFPLFSGEEVYSNEEKPDQLLVLPGRKLYNETSWDNTPPIGIFKARYTVSFEGVETVVEKLVIICPIWTIFVIILAILLLVTWLVMKNRSGKKKRAAASADAEGKSE